MKLRKREAELKKSEQERKAAENQLRSEIRRRHAEKREIKRKLELQGITGVVSSPSRTPSPMDAHATQHSGLELSMPEARQGSSHGRTRKLSPKLASLSSRERASSSKRGRPR